jgi:integrase
VGATYINRSSWAVSVLRNPDLYGQFPFSCRDEVEAYAQLLELAGFEPKLQQLDMAVQLVYREKGFRTFSHTFDSLQDAKDTATTIDSDRTRKIFTDYSESWRWTTAELIKRYLDEECDGHKGGESERYRLERLLRLAGVECERKETGKQSKRNLPKSEDSVCVEWLHKKFAQLTPTDIEEYINERLEQVKPGTVDRELDVLSQVYNTAIYTWRIKVNDHPMSGVRRPQYFNERDHRLKEGQEERLIAESQKEENPFVEVAIRLDLDTAMRRGELVSFTWDMVDFEQCCIHLPMTKNGRPHNVPLKSSAIELLQALPRNEGPVIGITGNALKKAFARVCKRAGITDLHFHDLRGESLSRYADSGNFTLLDLQAISGHRDIRMLQRYAHLCTKKLAARMDVAVQSELREYVHHGRKRVARLKLVTGATGTEKQALQGERAQTPAAESSANGITERAGQLQDTATVPGVGASPRGQKNNVIAFSKRQKAM